MNTVSARRTQKSGSSDRRQRPVRTGAPRRRPNSYHAISTLRATTAIAPNISGILPRPCAARAPNPNNAGTAGRGIPTCSATTRAGIITRLYRSSACRLSAGLTRLPSSEEVRGESPAGGSLGIARGAIADPDGNARSDFFGRAHGVGDSGLDGNFEGSGRALGARRSTATVRPAPPTQTTRGPDRPQGLLADTLLAAGHPVVPIHPNALKASRPRYSAAGSKSDPGDAFILADLLRTDGHRFRRLQPLSDETRALRALVRGRDDLVAERTALANQLRALLERVWPGAAALFAEVESPISLAFLTRYPTAQSAERLGEKRLARFLGQHSYCGRRSPAELL